MPKAKRIKSNAIKREGVCSMKKVVIVGAGIAGLGSGVYAARSGFDVTILEQHAVPGGLSASWSRKGYYFEGGLHWLTGSSEKIPLYKIWKEVGALQENNPVFYKDPIYTLMIGGGKKLCLYRNTQKLREELLNHAPEDKKMINRLCKDISYYKNVHLLIKDKRGLKCKNPKSPKISEVLKMWTAALRVLYLKNVSGREYISQFKSKDVRNFIGGMINQDYNALSLIYTLGSFSSGDCGYPEGGSARMAKNMADTFTSLGGKIEYRQNVEKVCMKTDEHGKKTVTGVIANGNFIEADAVIVTQDARQAIDDLFDKENPLEEKWIPKMKRLSISEQDMFFGFGIKADLKDYPRSMLIPLEKPFVAGGKEFYVLPVNNYALYPNHAPEGCTTLSCLLLGEFYDYWKKAKEDGTYKEKKQKAIDDLTAILEEKIPEFKGNIEVTDLATSLTNERFCKTFEGGYMNLMKAGMMTTSFPSKAQSVRGLYFAGQRMIMPGGLPMAIKSAWNAAQELCYDFGAVFE